MTSNDLSVLPPYTRDFGPWPQKQSIRFIELTSLKILLQIEVAFLIQPLKTLCWMTLEEIAYVLQSYLFSRKTIFVIETKLL